MDMELKPGDPMETPSEAPFLMKDAAAVAIVGGDESWRNAMRSELAALGLRIKAFASLDDLWQVIFCGEAFGALIQRTTVTIDWHASPEHRFKTGDMLLILHASHFRALAINDGSFENTAFEIASPSACAEELKRRLHMLLRNSEDRAADSSHEMVLGDYRFDLKTRVAKIKESTVSLTFAEFDIAAFLFRNRNCIVSVQQFGQLLKRNFPPGSRVLAVYMTRLRKKLSLRGEHGATLRAVYGRGYIVQLAPH